MYTTTVSDHVLCPVIALICHSVTFNISHLQANAPVFNHPPEQLARDFPLLTRAEGRALSVALRHISVLIIMLRPISIFHLTEFLLQTLTYI